MYAGRTLFHDLAVSYDTTPHCTYPGCTRIIERIVRIQGEDVQISDFRTPRMITVLARLHQEHIPAATDSQAQETISTLMRELGILMTCSTHSNHAVRFAEMWERDFYFGRHAAASPLVTNMGPPPRPRPSIPLSSMPARATPTYSIPLKQSTLDVWDSTLDIWDSTWDIVTITSRTQKVRISLKTQNVPDASSSSAPVVELVESGQEAVKLVPAPAGRAPPTQEPVSQQGGLRQQEATPELGAIPHAAGAPRQGFASQLGPPLRQGAVLREGRASQQVADQQGNLTTQTDARPDAIRQASFPKRGHPDAPEEAEPQDGALSRWEQHMERRRRELEAESDVMDVDPEGALEDGRGVAMETIYEDESDDRGNGGQEGEGP